MSRSVIVCNTTGFNNLLSSHYYSHHQILNNGRDQSLGQAHTTAAIDLEQVDYSSDEKSGIDTPDTLSQIDYPSDTALNSYPTERPLHPTHDDDGDVWIYPTPEEINGPDSLRRIVDKMYVEGTLAHRTLDP